MAKLKCYDSVHSVLESKKFEFPTLEEIWVNMKKYPKWKEIVEFMEGESFDKKLKPYQLNLDLNYQNP